MQALRSQGFVDAFVVAPVSCTKKSPHFGPLSAPRSDIRYLQLSIAIHFIAELPRVSIQQKNFFP